MADVRSLALRFEGTQLSGCLETQLANANNACYPGTNHEHAINVLAKAGFVQQQMQRGLSINQAIRDLGQRMRRMQGNEQ
jgi:hypothetical protein